MTVVFAGVLTMVVALPLASVVVAEVETVPFAVEKPIGIPATKRPSAVRTVAVTAVVKSDRELAVVRIAAGADEGVGDVVTGAAGES